MLKYVHYATLLSLCVFWKDIYIAKCKRIPKQNWKLTNVSPTPLYPNMQTALHGRKNADIQYFHKESEEMEPKEIGKIQRRRESAASEDVFDYLYRDHSYRNNIQKHKLHDYESENSNFGQKANRYKHFSHIAKQTQEIGKPRLIDRGYEKRHDRFRYSPSPAFQDAFNEELESRVKSNKNLGRVPPGTDPSEEYGLSHYTKNNEFTKNNFKYKNNNYSKFIIEEKSDSPSPVFQDAFNEGLESRNNFKKKLGRVSPGTDHSEEYGRNRYTKNNEYTKNNFKYKNNNYSKLIVEENRAKYLTKFKSKFVPQYPRSTTKDYSFAPEDFNEKSKQSFISHNKRTTKYVDYRPGFSKQGRGSIKKHTTEDDDRVERPQFSTRGTFSLEHHSDERGEVLKSSKQPDKKRIFLPVVDDTPSKGDTISLKKVYKTDEKSSELSDSSYRQDKTNYNTQGKGQGAKVSKAKLKIGREGQYHRHRNSEQTNKKNHKPGKQADRIRNDEHDDEPKNKPKDNLKYTRQALDVDGSQEKVKKNKDILRESEMNKQEFLNPHNIAKQLKCISHPKAEITTEIIGRTAEYHDIVLMKLSQKDDANSKRVFRSKNPNKYDDSTPEKKIIFIVHGLTVMGWHDLPCLSKTKKFKALLSYYVEHLVSFDIYLIPMPNPDGVAKHKPFWSKNVSPQSACPGVNLDRNFDVAWNSTRRDMSSCHQQYSGPTPFSEKETQAIRDIFHRYGHKIVGYFHVHAGTYNHEVFKGDAILYPKGYSLAQTDDDKYIDLRAEIEETMRNSSFKVISVNIDTLSSWYGIVGGSSVDYASTIYGIPYALELVMQIYKDSTKQANPDLREQNSALVEIWQTIIDVIFDHIYKSIVKTSEPNN